MDPAVLWALITAVWASVCLSAFCSILERRAFARRSDHAPEKSAVLGPSPSNTSTSRAGVSKASRLSAAVRELESGPTTALARPSPSNPSTSQRAGVSKASRLSATVRVVGDAESRTGGASARSRPEAGSQARADMRNDNGENVDDKGKWSGLRLQPSAFDLQPALATPSLPPQKRLGCEAKGLGVSPAGQKGSSDTSVLKRHSSDTSVISRRQSGRDYPAAMTPDTRSKAPAGVPKEFACSWEEGLPFGPLRRPAPVPGPVSLQTLPRTRSFERMIANDRQAPPTPPGHRRHAHSSGSLFYTNVIMKQGSRCSGV